MADPVVEDARALRSSIEGLCEALGIALTDAQRATLAASDAEALQQRFNALVRDRAWAS